MTIFRSIHFTTLEHLYSIVIFFIFSLLLFFPFPPYFFSYSFLLLSSSSFFFFFLNPGIKELNKAGRHKSVEEGGSKWEGSGELTTGMAAALGQKNQVELQLKQRRCALGLFMVPSPLGHGDDEMGLHHWYE